MKKLILLGFLCLLYTSILQAQEAFNILGRIVDATSETPISEVTISILNTSKTQKPNEAWLNLVVTSKAKSCIRSAMKEEKRVAGEFGKEALMRKFKSLNLNWSDENFDFLVKKLKLPSKVELFYQISQNKNYINKLKEFDSVFVCFQYVYMLRNFFYPYFFQISSPKYYLSLFLV